MSKYPTDHYFCNTKIIIVKQENKGLLYYCLQFVKEFIFYLCVVYLFIVILTKLKN